MFLPPLSSLSRSRCFIPPLPFFHSLLFISFASLLSLSVHVCTSRPYVRVYGERGKFRRSALYLRRASTSNGFDALGRNAYLSRAECVCTRVRGAIPHACARVYSPYTRMHVPIQRRAIRRVGKTREDSRIHTRTCRTGVNYASREMSNCSPYHKIYNSARCGKHYVLSRSFSSSPPWPFHPVSLPSTLPRVLPPSLPALVLVSHPRATVTIRK